jgi:predicted nucleotidyltransferase
MDEREIEIVWSLLDREKLAGIAKSGPEPVFATVSGAHLYGFASANSDVDLRGAFVLPARELLGLGKPRETLAVAEAESGLELDWVAHDIRKFARMMLQDNGYVLEQLHSPLVVCGGDELTELRAIARGVVTRGLHRHYRGFAHGRRKRLGEPAATVKHLLYAYRVYLSGIFVLTTGKIESNLSTLNEEYRVSVIDELIHRKREGSESERLAGGEIAEHTQRLDELELRLQRAHEASRLPDAPTSRDALEDFVVRLRLARLGA